ncbi:Carboxyl-terminal protease [hydrothermal vent metagenome]|uniref:Carboxyl-terminal protease n=1 Tax=hydrothermal vent metagenome TaxID=652676 RepID=A0A1W1CYZ1_9ZZZZ
MIYKLYFYTLILFVFTSCGNETADNNQNFKDSPIICQEDKSITSLYKEDYQKPIQFKAPQNLKLLLTDKKIAKKSSFDKQGLYNLFQTEYFWAEETKKNLDVSGYTEPQKLIDDIKYKDDRWSFAVTKKLYNDAISQKSIGFGFSCQDIEKGCLITYVRIDSPADKIDLRRGDIIQKINNQTATKELIYAKGQEKKLLKFELLRPNNNKHCSGKIKAREYRYKVVNSKILTTLKNEKIGYLRIDSFLGDNEILAQINNSFNNFKKNSIQKLVIDLRYNGGGSVDLASKLLDKLVINKENQTQFTLAWNKAYQNRNQKYSFAYSLNALDLKQILFLTTRNSASASELIISAMKPYLPEEDVVIVGDRTHGKPVGMSGQNDGTYYYFLINFVVKNSLGFYDYFDGLSVTSGCNVADDPFHEMGDPKESMLKSALQYIDTGSCQ